MHNIIEDIECLIIESEYSLIFERSRLGELIELISDILDKLDSLPFEIPIADDIKEYTGISIKQMSLLFAVLSIAVTYGLIKYKKFTSIKYKLQTLKKLRLKYKETNDDRLLKKIQALEIEIKEMRDKLKIELLNKKESLEKSNK
jgi:uncharacterized membrane protein (DUF106 family)